MKFRNHLSSAGKTMKERLGVMKTDSKLLIRLVFNIGMCFKTYTSVFDVCTRFVLQNSMGSSKLLFN